MVSGFLLFLIDNKLSLGELRSTTSCFETVLLSFLHSGVTGEKTGLLEGRTESFCICLKKSSGDTVTDGACLTGYTAAYDVANDIKLAHVAGEFQGLTNDELEGLKTKILVDILLVDGYNTRAGYYAYACNGLLSSSCAVEIRL